MLVLVLSDRFKQVSKERCIQRFISGYTLDSGSLGRFMPRLVLQGQDVVVSIDRTNWRIERTDVNVCHPATKVSLILPSGSSSPRRITRTQVVETFQILLRLVQEPEHVLLGV